MSEDALRAEIIATAIRMNDCGINRGKSGNVSARTGAGFLITPTGLAYESLSSKDIVAMTLAGEASGARLPSSEWRFHRDIYASRAEPAPLSTRIRRLRHRSPVSGATFQRSTT